MRLFKKIYEKATGKKAPYYYNYSIFTIINKPLRKFVTQVIAPNCPIGMKCYFDDMCYDLLKVGNNVTISYGVYFACHGKNQGHYPITIEDGAYIGMRACVISKNKGGGVWKYSRSKCHGWCLCFNQPRCTRRLCCGRNSLQDYQWTDIRNEVSPA